MKPTTVAEYLNSFPDDKKATLTELHAIVRRVLPDTDEALKWGAPATIERDGMILLVFSGHKEHINFVVTPSALASAKDELADYVTGKGSVQLAYDKPIPTKLIEKLAAYRAKEYRENGVKWK